MKSKIPNYTMLRLLLVESQLVMNRYSNVEQMPKGYICPGFDIQLMQPLAVLKYLCGVKTQWSCQGNHKDQILNAYILLPPGECFPQDLIEHMSQAGFIAGEVKDYDENGYTGKTRFKITSSWYKNSDPEQLKIHNEKFLTLLKDWSRLKIIEHLPNMTGHYFSDVQELYQIK